MEDRGHAIPLLYFFPIIFKVLYIVNPEYILVIWKIHLEWKNSDKPSLSPCIPFLSPFASFREEKNLFAICHHSCILPEMSTTSKSKAISPQRSARWNTLTINVLDDLPSSIAKLFKDDACHKTQQALSNCRKWKVGKAG